jgi:hypothetical protein
LSEHIQQKKYHTVVTHPTEKYHTVGTHPTEKYHTVGTNPTEKSHKEAESLSLTNKYITYPSFNKNRRG